ncbi:MAG: TetR/AcrR family transcriptional regulator [Clostridia bacterium]|nr:TetR/AcrR family transcriptional regulator [Clostridia bacterium]MBR0444708.1 TetR/AcrR family transcriptional regulator [Clostridia bacterium]
MSTDARVRYTQKMIRDALFDCLKEKPLMNVTVKEVCDRAGINRATFYYHYKDCNDVVEQLENSQIEEFRQIMSENEKFGLKLTKAILDMLEKNRALNEAVVQGQISDTMKVRMKEVFRQYSFRDWKKKMAKATDEQVEMMLSSISAAVFQIAVTESGRYDRHTTVLFIHDLVASAISVYV